MEKKYIYISYGLIFLMVPSLLLGLVYKSSFLLLLLGLIVLYRLVDKRHLRCPNCGGFINLDKLRKADKVELRCIFCQELLELKESGSS